MKRRTAIPVLLAAAALALAGCSSGGGSTTTTPPATAGGGATTSAPMQQTSITVGVIPIVDVAPIYLGVDKGFFKDAGLDVKLDLAQGGAAIVPAVVSGQYQFGFSNTTSLLLATANNVPLQIVAAGDSTTGDTTKDFGAVVTEPKSGIKTAKDLSGKKIAVNTLNNIGTSTIQDVVEKAGGDPKSIKFVEMGFPDMPAQLKSGNIDAAWVVEPFLTISEGQGAVPITYNFAEVDKNLMIAAYFTSDSYAQSHPEVVAAFEKAMNQSMDYATAHPDEARAALDTYTKLDPSVRDSLLLPKWPTTVDQNSLTILNDLAVKYGLLKAAADTSKLLP